VEGYTRDEAARSAGVTPVYLDRLIELGLVEPDADGRITDGGIRRILLLQSLDESGTPIEALEGPVRSGAFLLDFIESAGYEVFAPLGQRTFAEVAADTGISTDLLVAVREVMGGMMPAPDDRMREDELAVVPWIDLMLSAGVRPVTIERTLRVYGDTQRRAAETEGEWWRTDIQDRFLGQGKTEADIAAFARDFSPALSGASDAAIMAIYHAQQRLSWGANIVNGVALALERAGLHTRREVPPAMCFMDISGYTRLTQEQGDTAAADLAEQVARVVERTSSLHGGRPVKWLGDGVMVHFRDARDAAVGALALLEGVREGALPPAHVGVHAGPVIFQQGDYFGQTVNVAARIGEYARAGEVLVSQEVVEASSDTAAVTFRELGPVELKGVSGALTLYQALQS
jgi:adenylate cyclase